jgi:hypothetical protein
MTAIVAAIGDAVQFRAVDAIARNLWSQSMKHQIVGRYRGFVIEARIEQRTARSSDGVALRYRVSWSLRTVTSKQKIIGDFADPVIYDSDSIALTCVDRAARAFIDAMLADGFERLSRFDGQIYSHRFTCASLR